MNNNDSNVSNHMKKKTENSNVNNNIDNNRKTSIAN